MVSNQQNLNQVGIDEFLRLYEASVSRKMI